MRSEVFLPDFDFRDFLPMIDRAIFKSPFNPSEVWKKLGTEYNRAMWERALKKYRIRIYEEKAEKLEVAGEFVEDYNRIELTVQLPEKFKVSKLKFLLIQTMMHEFVHVNQFHAHEEQYDKTIGYYPEMVDDEEYLSRWGEIQAFGHCAALDTFNDLSDTQLRYSCINLPEKTKREFYRQLFRWINKYSDKYSVKTILIEQHEPLRRSNFE